VQTSPAVVVGIDGSRFATAAAIWAIDEAASRDIPLRLVHAVTPTDGAHLDADDLARAGRVVQSAVAAVEANGKPVKVETQITPGRAAHVLRSQSRDASMLCVGSSGLTHGGSGPVDRTAAAVALTASCPVAIIHSAGTNSKPGWVVVEVNDSPAGELVLRTGVEEALLRGAALRVVATWPSRYPDIHDDGAVANKNRSVKAQWERRLAPWRLRHPELEVHAVATPGSILNYLARHRDPIGLAIVPHERAAGVAELLAPRGRDPLRDGCFDVLICEPDNAP
jgi:nucleotide-binding universal stress UspA family protein